MRVFMGETQGALPLDPAKGSSTLWTPIFAIELSATAYSMRVFIQKRIKPTANNPKAAAPKVSEGRAQASSVFVAPLSRPQARNPCAYSAFTSAFTSANWLSTSDSFTTDDGE